MLHLMHPTVLVIHEVVSRNINLETIFFLLLHIRRCNIDLGSHSSSNYAFKKYCCFQMISNVPFPWGTWRISWGMRKQEQTWRHIETGVCKSLLWLQQYLLGPEELLCLSWGSSGDSQILANGHPKAMAMQKVSAGPQKGRRAMGQTRAGTE